MAKERASYGSGTVYKQGNSFVSQLSYAIIIEEKEYNKRITGSGKSEAAAIRNRNKNAKKWEEKLRKSLKEAANPEGDMDEKMGITLDEVFEKNLALKGTQVQIPTSDNYEVYYTGYVKNSAIGKSLIDDITEEQLLEFYMTLRTSGRKRVRKDKNGIAVTPKPLSINTVNHVRFVLYNTFKYAEEKGLIQKNVHAGIRPFKAGTMAMVDFDQEDLDADSDESDALQRVIPVEEVEKILKYAFENSQFAALYAWALNSGMRQGECLGLKTILAAPDSGYICVRKSLTYIRDRREGAKQRTIPKLKSPKNGKERNIPYNESLREIYNYQLKQIEQDKKAAGKLYHDKGLLFADEYGDYLRPWKVLKEFQDILETVGIKKHRFHDLRHTFVSLLVKESQKTGEGCSILDVCAIVGHRDAQVTLSVYAGLFPNSTERAMKVLDKCKEIGIPA